MNLFLFHDLCVAIALTLFVTGTLALGSALGDWSRSRARGFVARRARRFYQLQSHPVALSPGESTWISLFAPRDFIAEEVLVTPGFDVRVLKLDGETLKLGKLTGETESSFPRAVPDGAVLQLLIENRSNKLALASFRVEGHQ